MMPAQDNQTPRVMIGLYIYQGGEYFGQIIENVGPGLWLILEADERSFRIESATNLKTAYLYREKPSAD